MIKKTTIIRTQLYSCLKVAEGGRISQKDAMYHLNMRLGMSVRRANSPYIGQYGIEATGTEVQHDAAEKFLFG